MSWPVLFFVFTSWPPQSTVPGEITANGPPPTPTIASACGLAGPSSVKLRNAPSGPTTEPTNPTSNEHFCPGAIGPAAVHAPDPISEKSAAFAPVIPTCVMFSGASPVLITPTAWGGTVVEPTGCVP